MTLLAAYAFDEGSGTVAADAVGTRDLTMSSTGWAAGLSGTTALLGESNTISVPSFAGLETAQRTIMFWARSDAGGTHWLVEFYNSGPDTAMFGIGWIAGNLLFRTRIGGVNTNFSTPIVDQATFHHFAITFDGAQMVAYRDAVALSTMAAAGTIDAATALLLVDSGQPTIEDLRFADTALTQPEIAALMNERVVAEILGDVEIDVTVDVDSVGVVGKSSGAPLAPSVAIVANAEVAVAGQAQITSTAAVSATATIDGSGGTTITETVTVTAAGVTSPAVPNPGGVMRVVEILSDILDLLTSEESEGGCPLPCFCRVAVYPGLEVPWDSCSTGGTCGECDGQLYAAVQSVTRVQGDGVGACKAYQFTALVGAVRCAAQMSDDDLNPLPSVEAVQNDAIRQARDADGIRYAIECCPTRPQRLKDAGIVLDSWAPLGPQGGCAGGAWTIRGRFDVCC